VDVLGCIDSWAQATPERIAHVSAGRALTYGELGRRSDALAAHLVEELKGDTSPVAVIGHKEPEMLVAFLGAAKAGRAYVPIDSGLPAQRRERIVAGAGARLTLTPDRVAALSSGDAPAPLRTGRDSDPYYVIFTSGSTGEPKGVVITHSCLASFLHWMLAEQRFDSGTETFLNQAPFSFDLSVMDLYLSLVTGGTLVSLTSDDIANPRQLYRTLSTSEVTTWVSTPSFAQLCLAEPGFAAAMLPALRRFLFCGETLPPAVAAQLLERFPTAAIWNTYGPTEATVATTSVLIDRDILRRYAPLPVGAPMPGARIVIRDDAGRSLADGERGEIVIAGPNVSPGYLDAPALTERAFFDLDGQRAYRTGDQGRVVDGMLFFEGRIDSQIKLNGYRIELGDIEANLRADPLVRDAVVVVMAKAGRADSLAAFVILREPAAVGATGAARALRSRLAERVPAYMLPRKVCLVDAFPMTGNGKADRRALAASLGKSAERVARTATRA